MGGLKSASKAQRNTINAAAAPLNSESTANYNNLVSSINANRNGFTPEEQASITQATMGGTGAQFAGAREQAANSAARSRDAASYAPAADSLARDQGRTTGQLAAQNQESFAKERINQNNTANSQLAQLFGVTSDEFANLMGSGVKAAGQQGPDWEQTLMGLGGAAGNIFGK